MKKFKKYGLVAVVLIFIGLVSFYYRDYLLTDKDVRASPDELIEQRTAIEEKCKSLSTSCSGVVEPVNSKGQVNEAGAKEYSIELCNQKIVDENTKKEDCLVKLRDNIESCNSYSECEVVGLTEEDSLSSCDIANSWPCVETVLNNDGTVTVCVQYSDPYKRECSNPRQRQESDIIGWSCTAKSGKYSYGFNCQAKVQ